MKNVLIANNTSNGAPSNADQPDGGGVYIQTTPGAVALDLENVTISGNVTNGNGGGIAANASGSSTSTLTNVTITNNRADDDNNGSGTGGGVFIPSGPVLTLQNTIVAGNFKGTGATADDISGTLPAGSTYNMIGNGGSGGLTNGTNNNIVTATPLLAPLGLYGVGVTTQTHALLPGSPAINAGSNTLATAKSITTDARGINRPQLTTDDIGSYESRGFTLSKVSGDNQSASVSTAFAAPLIVGVMPNASGEPVDGGAVTFTPPGAGASATLGRTRDH